MKFDKIILLFTVTLACIAFSACSKPKEIVYKSSKNFSLEKMGLTNTAIKMDLIYYNPNNFGLQLKEVDLDIYIDGTFLGHTVQDTAIKIPAKADFTLPIKVNVDTKNAFKNMFNTLFSKSIMVKAVGTVKVGKLNIYKRFPVNYEGKQQL